jgi:tetratricopeptide (TPR) repeat protein
MQYRPLDYFQRADEAAKRGDLDTEIDVLKELLSLCLLSGEPADHYAEALRWLGNAYQAKNNIPRAHSYRLEALKIVEQLGDRCNDYVAMCVVGDMGRSFMELAEWQEAEVHTRRALSIAESRQSGDKSGLCIYRMNLGLILSNTGRDEEAIQLGELVLRDADSLDDPHYVLALQSLNLGSIHLHSSRLNECQEHTRRGMVHADFCYQTYIKPKARKVLGDCYFRAWDATGRDDYHDEATRILKDVVRDASKAEDFSTIADTELELIRLAAAGGHKDLADMHCVRAIEALEQTHSALGFEELSLKYFSRWDETYDRAAQLQLRRNNPDVAFLTSERSRARLLLARLGAASSNTSLWSEEHRRQLEQALDDYGAEVIATCRADMTRGAAATRTFGLKRDGGGSADPPNISEARATFIRAQDRQRLYASRWSNALMSPAAEETAIRGSLGSDDAMISFQVCEAGVLVFVLTRDNFHFQQIPYPRAKLAQQVQTLCDLMADLEERSLSILKENPVLRREWWSRKIHAPHPGVIEGRFRRLLEVLGNLYAILISPVLAVVNSKKNWIVVPHGPLHRVPWAALWTGSEYVVQQHYVAVQPSASFSLALSKRKAVSNGKKALLFGAPDAPEDPMALPGAVDELEAARSALGIEEPPDLRESATKATFLQKAPGATVIHVAAHHFFDGAASGLSFLKLAGNRGAGFLFACEVAEMKLSAQLGILSACETSRSHVVAGDEQYGMVRSFFAAGTRSVISTLWPIEDASAPILFTAFYKEARGSPLIEALGNAQREMLRQSPYDLPYFWAPYVFSGEWNRPLDFDGMAPA